MANIVIKPASGTLEFNTGVVAGSAVDTTLSGASRLTFDSGELNLVSYATGNLNRFTVDGSTSRLFSAYDQMSGSLMSINTIAGFPVFEAFSDNTIVLGKHGSKDFVSTGNKIGIGTAAPANKLEVFGTGDISVRITTTGSAAATDFAALRFFQAGVQKGSVIANSGVLRIGAGDGIGTTSGVYISSAGSVGIGISPAYPLQIGRSGGKGSLAISVNNVMSQYGRDSLYLAIADDTADVAGHAWYVRNLTATDNFAMGINNLGNVGIGTTTPNSKLEVSGTIRTHANTGAQAFAAPANGGILIGEYGNGGAGELQLMTVNSANGYGFKFMGNVAQGNLELFRRQNSTTWSHVMSFGVADGNVGIGTTAPLYKLDVNGTAQVDVLRIGYSTNQGTITYGGGLGMVVKSASSQPLSLGAAGRNSDITILSTDGNVGIGTTTPSGKLEAYGTGDISLRITTSGNAAATDFAALRFFQAGSQKGSVIANNSVLRLSAGTNLSGIFISDSGNVGINSIPTGTNNVRFQVNGGVGSNVAALRFENCGIVGSGSLGIGEKTFSGWLPIQINSSTTRYIPIYA